MIKNVLSDMGGVGVYGVISILLFFTVFITALILVLRTKRPYLNHMGSLPLEDGSLDSKPATPSSHE